MALMTACSTPCTIAAAALRRPATTSNARKAARTHPVIAAAAGAGAGRLLSRGGSSELYFASSSPIANRSRRLRPLAASAQPYGPTETSPPLPESPVRFPLPSPTLP